MPRVQLTRTPAGYEFHFRPTDQLLTVERAPGDGWRLSCRGWPVGQVAYPTLAAIRQHIAAALADAGAGEKVRW